MAALANELGDDRLQRYLAPASSSAGQAAARRWSEFTAARWRPVSRARRGTSRLGGAHRPPQRRAGRRRRSPPPAARRLRAEDGAGQVTLRWEPVEGAIGYRPAPGGRARRAVGEGRPRRHGRALPPRARVRRHHRRAGQACWYAIASVAAEEDGPGELSAPVRAKPRGAHRGADDRARRRRGSTAARCAASGA